MNKSNNDLLDKIKKLETENQLINNSIFVYFIFSLLNEEK